MPEWAQWAGTPIPLLDAAHKAVRAWARILDKPSRIVLVREGIDQPPQTVRIEYERYNTGVDTSPTGQTQSQSVVIYGVRNHPALNVPDTDLAVGDRFYHDRRWFELTSLMDPTGEIQGFGEAQRFGP